MQLPSALSSLSPQNFSLIFFFPKKLTAKNFLIFSLELEAYSQPKAYSEHFQTNAMGRFAKIVQKIKT